MILYVVKYSTFFRRKPKLFSICKLTWPNIMWKLLSWNAERKKISPLLHVFLAFVVFKESRKSKLKVSRETGVCRIVFPAFLHENPLISVAFLESLLIFSYAWLPTWLVWLSRDCGCIVCINLRRGKRKFSSGKGWWWMITCKWAL